MFRRVLFGSAVVGAAATGLSYTSLFQGASKPTFSSSTSLLNIAHCAESKSRGDSASASPRAAVPSLSLSEPDPNLYELVQVQMIMRHGARSPCSRMAWETHESFANEWKLCHQPGQAAEDPALHSCYPGQLTQAGELMCVELGKRIKRRYIDELGFLQENFDEKDLHIQSTKYPRARLSLERVLDGMFSNGAVSREALNAAVDPLETMIPKTDKCANLLRRSNAANEEMRVAMDADPEVFAMMRAAEKVTGMPFNHNIVPYGDWAHSRTFHGLPLLEGLPENFLSVIDRAAWQKFRHIGAGDYTATKLSGGPFLEMLAANLERFLSRTNQGQEPRFRIYSGHDTTIVPLAAALGTPVPNWPPFSTHIELELWRERGSAVGITTPPPSPSASVSAPANHSASGMKAIASESIETVTADPVFTSPTSPTSSSSSSSSKPRTPPLATSYPHVNARHPSASRPMAFHDPHWVRVIFNGTAVASLPFAQFQERIKHYRMGSEEVRRCDCGPEDPTLPRFQW